MSPEMYWLETVPPVVILFFAEIGPCIKRGQVELPGTEVYAFAPSWLSASTTWWTGRFLMLSSPVKMLHPLNVAAIGDKK